MSKFTITRTNIALPDDMDGARQLLFQALDGFGEDDRKSWRRLWKKLIELKTGEVLEIQTTFPRSGPAHRRHMAIEQRFFDSQEQFETLDSFRTWAKVGAGYVIWAPSENGALVPIPKSISYAAADQDEFDKFHAAVIRFLRSEHAARFLWGHLEERAVDQAEYILRSFGE